MRGTLIFAVIFGFMVHIINCQSISICANPINGQSCAITCNTTDFSQDVQFLLGTSGQGICTVVGAISACGPGLSQSGTITTLTIAALSRGTHDGDWSCRFGTSTSSPVPLVVKTVPGTIGITQTIPDANATVQPIDDVTVSAECYCIFPSPSVVSIIFKQGVLESKETVPSGSVSRTQNPGLPCLLDEYKIEIKNYTVKPKLTGRNVYLQVQFGSYKTADYGVFDFAVSPPTPDECPLFQYAFWPCFCIVLVGTLLVIGVSYHVGKDSQLQEGSLKKSCGCCPSDNKFCMAVFPLCTDALCTGSKKTGLSTTAKNVISVVVFLCVAAVIGVIIAFGLGVDSGKCTLALILSIVCGLVLVEIFTVSVYPHWPCLPEKGQDGRNCFNACRIVPKEETKKTDENDSGKKKPQKKTDENDSGKKKPQKKPAENQDPPNRETPRSPQATASASGIELMTAEGRSPRPLENLPALPGIGSEAKQPTPISNEESTLKKKPLNTALPETPNNKLPPVDTVNNEEDKPKKRRKRKKKREGEENDEEDKRDSQNSGGQANVEEEE